MTPTCIHLIEGTAAERAELTEQMLRTGMLIPCAPELRPGSYIARSTPDDVARLEARTFICSATEAEAGPTNNWREPSLMRSQLSSLFQGSMAGRTLFVVPFLLGPAGSAFSRVGFQVTDSPYVVVNLMILSRVGRVALQAAQAAAAAGQRYVKALHSVGKPLALGQPDTPWPSNADKYICHFPETLEAQSYGSGYGGNALLNKKSFALRLATVMGRQEGWLAEHMMIAKVSPPAGQGRPIFIAGAFPSACGKTNLAMCSSTLPGWKVEVVGDDIAWLHLRKSDGALLAINPEAGFFGVASGTSSTTNASALAACRANTIFTNVAQTREGDVWWEGLSKQPPAGLTSWLRKPWQPGCGELAAHANSRFSAPASQCPVLAPEWEDPAGVPLDAILFGGRRASTVPLVYQTRNWASGVYAGATTASERTAAAEGVLGELRYDPMAIKPFCGYNMSDYFKHWLSLPQWQGAQGGKALPLIFNVNWFQKSEGRFLWPGFGDNIRVLAWIHGRVTGTAQASESPIGWVPEAKDLDLSGLTPQQQQDAAKAMAVDAAAWSLELAKGQAFLSSTFQEGLPPELLEAGRQLQLRCQQAQPKAELKASK